MWVENPKDEHEMWPSLRTFTLCCNLTKGYWMRNNENKGWEWNENFHNINKIHASSMKKVSTASGDYLISKNHPPSP